jgi:hypothetical protein
VERTLPITQVDSSVSLPTCSIMNEAVAWWELRLVLKVITGAGDWSPQVRVLN